MKKRLLVVLISLTILCSMVFPFPVSAGDGPEAAADPFQSQDQLWNQEAQSSATQSGGSSAAQELPGGRAGSGSRNEDRADSYNIKFENSVSLSDIHDCVKNYDYRLLGDSSSRLFNIQTDDIQKFKATYKNIIETAEPDHAMSVSAVPNDTYYSTQWAIPDINLPQAWNTTEGSSSVKVADIDTGFCRTLTDFNASSVLPGYDITGSHAGVTTDTMGHGTEVCSVIGAATNNAYGIAGACWNVSIVPYKVDNSNGYLYDSDVITALDMAADAGCDVINMSFGGYTYDSALNTAIQYARGKGCILVAAAGNEGATGNSEAGQLSYPASYDGVVSAAAVNGSNTASSFSQHNSRVDVAAPGEHISLDDPDYDGRIGLDTFVYGDGTSFASPYVSAIAALARTRNDALDSDDFQNLIAQTSTDLGAAGKDNYYGYGLVNAQAIVNDALTITDPSSSGLVIGTATGLITGYTGHASNLVIPSQIAGVTVTGIGDNVFNACSSLKTVTIQGNIKSIGNSAFVSCSALTSMTIPSSVTSIGTDAFEGCTVLNNLSIPSGVKSINDGTFKNCAALDNVTIPNGVTSIGSSAFYGCNTLSSITVPVSVTSIGVNAFGACTGLTSATMLSGVKSIGDDAFKGCTKLASVSIPGSVTSIGYEGYYGCADKGVFSGCTNLMSVTIQNGLKTIGIGAFSGCAKLTGINIPDSVTGISVAAFSGCTSLSAVTGCNNVTKTASDAFDGTPWLAAQGDFAVINGTLMKYQGNALSFQVPDGVTQIGCDAFAGRTDITGVTLPDSVTSIDNEAFDGCASLARITIPDGVSSIETDAFYGCNVLTIVGDTGFYAQAYAVSNLIPFSTVTGITLKSGPSKNIYIEGAGLDLSGLMITVHNFINSTENVDVTSDMLSGYNTDILGEQTVTITYEECTVTFGVTVNAKTLTGIVMKSPPNKTTFIEG